MLLKKERFDRNGRSVLFLVLLQSFVNKTADVGMDNATCIAAVMEMRAEINGDVVDWVNNNECACGTVPAKFSNGRGGERNGGIHVDASAKTPAVAEEHTAHEIVLDASGRTAYLSF